MRKEQRSREGSRGGSRGGGSEEEEERRMGKRKRLSTNCVISPYLHIR